MDKGDSMFVKISDYKDVVDVLELVRRKLSEAKSTLDGIQRLKSEEEKELNEWAAVLDNIESKVNSIDSMLSRQEEKAEE